MYLERSPGTSYPVGEFLQKSVLGISLRQLEHISSLDKKDGELGSGLAVVYIYIYGILFPVLSQILSDTPTSHAFYEIPTLSQRSVVVGYIYFTL